eukprot:CAMPEP_0172501682 /NCGR_PEP_ID=MMETSP1066-20121228/152348_1 /TAXON_ID=671091 /ORGANISM="Coscinodiscus wailesii, Strain CCMP2513" /LENGTH=213 /DNA_ID=CAMNT_0013276617 /DNA_START=106 /DNA_END=747 /DNA_ORIENTATION=+
MPLKLGKSFKKLVSRKRLSAEERKSLKASKSSVVKKDEKPVVDDVPQEQKQAAMGEESTVETDKTEENGSVTVGDTAESDKEDSKEPKEDDKQSDDESKEEPQQDESLDDVSLKSEEDEDIKKDEQPALQESLSEEPQLVEEPDSPPRASTPPPQEQEHEEENVSVASSAPSVHEIVKVESKTEEQTKDVEECAMSEKETNQEQNTGLFCGCF